MSMYPPTPVSDVYSESATARTTTGTQALALDASVGIVTVSVNITAVSGTSPTLTLALQQQDANSNWYTVATTAALTATGVTAFSVGPGTANGHSAVGKASRLQWTIGGSASPSVTFQASVQARE